MSRIGKKPIPLPSGVKIAIGEQLEVTGPKGKLTVPIPAGHQRRAGQRQARGEARRPTITPRCTG